MDDGHAVGIVGGNELDAAGRTGASSEARADQSRNRINPHHLDSGLIICGECDGDPSQYLIDFEETCPSCGGCGFHDDPDYVDGDARGFSPHAEWGTYRVIRGRIG